MEEVRICDKGGHGLVFPLMASEHTWTPWIRALLYTMALVYIFLGVNIVADKFMSSIEAITSKKLRVQVRTTGRTVTVKKWNDTVANLTLMALGSSAPEILLSIMEIIMSGFHSGKLGPSTIVGSAAFNLFVIIAVCIFSIPNRESRAIKEYSVFVITAIFSLFAYFWLVFIVQLSSPDVVEIWEGSVTLALFPVLIVISYGADVGWFASGGKRSTSSKYQTELPEEDRPALEAHINQQTREESICPYRPGPPAIKRGGSGDEGAGQTINDLDGQPIVNKNGVFTFESDTMNVMGGSAERVVKVPVYRRNGSKGTVKCHYRMEKLTAIPGYDYKEEDGVITLGPGMCTTEIEVTILPKKKWENSDSFQIILEDASGGAVFNPNDDGGEDSCLLTITITNADAPRKRSQSAKLLSFLDGAINVDAITYASGNWWEDIVDSIFSAGGDENEPPTDLDKVLHVLSIPWKFAFAVLIPPAAYAGGWICFVLSLVFIGGLTAIIIDFAELFGCVTGIEDSITAITFVALGTSMPDLFASMTAAAQDDNADASIVNVTGSNSVNVFLGIGIPWTIAAVYWSVTGANDDWMKHYPTFKGAYPNGAFIVEGGDLAFSVVVFSFAAVIALAVIRMRKGAELGGNFTNKALSSCLFLLLWLFYIALSIWKVTSPAADAGQQVIAIVIGLVVLENVLLFMGGVLKCWQLRHFQEMNQESARSESSEGTQAVEDDEELLEIITKQDPEQLHKNMRTAALAVLAVARLKRRSENRKASLLASGTYDCVGLRKGPITEPLKKEPQPLGRAVESRSSAACHSWQPPPPLPAPTETPVASAVASGRQAEAAAALPVVVGRPVAMGPASRTVSFTAAAMSCLFIARLRNRRARRTAHHRAVGAAAASRGGTLERCDSFHTITSLQDVHVGIDSASSSAQRPPAHTLQAPSGPPVARGPPAAQASVSFSPAPSQSSSQSGTVMRPPPQGGLHALAAVSRNFMKFLGSHIIDWVVVGAVGYMAGQHADPNTAAAAGF